MLDTVVRIGSPDEGEAEVNIAKESGRARFDQQPMSLSMSGGFNMNPEAASTYTQEPQLPGAADSAIVAKSIQAKSLPMASTNPMPNPPAVGAGYNAARKGSNGAVPGGTPGDAPGDVPVDAPGDTPFDTAIVPGGQVEPSEVSSPIESPRWTPESLMNSYSSPTNEFS